MIAAMAASVTLVRADEQLTAFLELESAIRAAFRLNVCPGEN
jgi:hypothetical protein